MMPKARVPSCIFLYFPYFVPTSNVLLLLFGWIMSACL